MCGNWSNPYQQPETYLKLFWSLLRLLKPCGAKTLILNRFLTSQQKSSNDAWTRLVNPIFDGATEIVSRMTKLSSSDP